jgi:hypothetical protein
MRAGPCLFDPGTVQLGENQLAPYMTGLFHGRPASISIGSSFTGDILVRVSGHFYRPFEVRSNWPHARGIINKAMRIVASPLIYPLIWPLFFLHRATPEGSLGEIVFAIILFFFLARLVLFLGSRLLKNYYIPEGSTGKLSFADSVSLKYLTYVPDGFTAIVARREFQDTVTRLIGGFQLDLLKSDGSIAAPSRSRGWGLGGTAEAKFAYREKLLNRDAFREILTELSTLCGSIEQAGSEEESVSQVAPEPL